jgi:lysophospholipase L1-like esterase
MIMTLREKITVVCFGDSITEAEAGVSEPQKRWPDILGRRLSEEFPGTEFSVINSGVGGNSAREAMARYERDVTAHNPDYVLLEFGGNNDDPKRRERRVDETEFREHLRRFRDGLPAKTKVVVITFPQVIDSRHIYSTYPEYQELKAKYGGHDARVEMFRNITREFARENGYPVADLSAEMRKFDAAKHTLPDGVHLTEDGNRLLAGMIFEILRRGISRQQ